MNNFSVNPHKRLLKRVLECINKKQRLFIMRRVVAFSLALAISLLAFLPALRMLSQNIIDSGFIHFASLIFSDFSIVMTHWKIFALILLETLPIVSLILFLIVLFLFLESVKYLSKNIKIILGLKQSAVA